MINEKFNEAVLKNDLDAIIQHWKEVNTPSGGMEIENPDPKILDNKNAEIKTTNQPE